MRAKRGSTRRSSIAALVLAIGCAALSAGFEIRVRAAVALTAVAPLGASAGVPVQITGTGFDPVASNNTVTLTPQGGAPINLVGETIATLDAATGLRRLGVTVPSGLPVGAAAVLVRNRTTNESAGGRTLQIIHIALPETSSAARGAQQVAVRITGSANVQFVTGRTTPTFGAGITVAATQVLSPTSLIATVSVSASTSLGPRPVSVVTSTQTALLPGGFTVTSPNRPPTIISSAVTTGAESQPYRYQVVAADPDGDAVSYRLVASPSGMTIAAGLIAWTPNASHVGDQDVVVEATDGRGGTNRQSFRIAVSAAPQLQAIDVQPALLRFAMVDTTRPLTVTGLRTNGATIDLTSPATGTTYETSNAFVARVAPDGTVTGVANGSATITARNGALNDTAAVVVEAGVTLDALELTPAAATLRSPGATQVLALRGRFSDGSFRDLTTAPGTTYESSNGGVAGVSAAGTVTAVANGGTAVTARHDDRSAAASIVVSISGGVGFLRGEAYDDSKGLPLGEVTVSLVSDGGGPVTTPVAVIADERGQFSIAGRAGDAIVRIGKAGFTAVERRASIPVESSTTLFDARLTPVDPRVTLVSSAVGGQARNDSGRATLQVPPGGLPTDQSLSLTTLSPQGLAALLPAGWSPIAAVAIGPANVAFGFPLTLTLPNTSTLPQGLALALVRYDEATHEWIGAGTATIDAGGLTVRATVDRTGQFACLLPDQAPFTPAEPVLGAVLAGVDRPTGQTTGVTALGEVVPRSAPPGDDARAVGRVGVITPVPAPSGTFIQARVSEQFDLLDQTHIVTQPFTQDLVSYATPRPGLGGTLGASFPITPSRSFTIQELMIGVVRLDVTPFAGGDPASVLGPGGGVVTSADGDTLQIPFGALADNVPVALRRLTVADAGVTAPAGFDLLAVVQVDMVGVSFSAPAQLSTTAAGGVTAQDQVLVARVFSDPFGQRRLKLVAVAELSGAQLIARTTFGTLSLTGVRSGGEFVYLRAQQPGGFLVGTVTRAGGAPRAGVLVTSDSVGVADVTGADGRYLVAGRTGIDTTLRALDPASRDGVSAVVRLDTAGQILTADLTLGVTGPTVVAVNPAAGATSVALDTSVTIDFSEALDVSSVTAAAVVLQVAGTAVTAERIVSADARRVIIRPSAPLTALSTYTLHLTAGLRDLSGNPLTGFTPASFTTLDPSRPAQPAPGRIVAELPDDSGFVLITGAPGVAAGGSAVTVINVRTQETTSVLALADGSFRLRITAIVGDELTLVLRGADGRDTTIGITQFHGADGSVTVGAAGGTIAGPGERIGTILSRALAAAGTFRIEAEDAGALPLLPGGFSYADSFSLSVSDATFTQLTSLTLTESQNRFAPVTIFTAPFSSAAELTTPPDALVNSTLRFTAVAQDADGRRRTVGAATAIVAGAPDSVGVSTSHTSDFPTLFVTAPREALPGQQAAVSAVAPAARIELETPPPAGVLPTDTLLLVHHTATAAAPGLAVIDQLSMVTPGGGSPRARTSGRAFPGMTAAGHYAIVSTHEAVVLVTGIVSGAQATVTVDGLPFVFTTAGPNGHFIVPVRANAAFTLRFVDGNGTVRGTATGQAPASGTIDAGDPLATTAGLLTVTGDPDERSVVDINAPLVLNFSEPVDGATVSSALVVTDDAGSRVFGRLVIDAGGVSATFTPSRRWRFGTRYRYGVGTTVLARSGARLRTPFNAQFTTFQPSVVGTLAMTGARDVSVTGATAVVATATGIATVDVASPRAPRLLGQLPVTGGANGVTILSAAPTTDRNGQLHTGPLALVASGTASTGGHLRSFDLTTPGSPVALGSTQLTNAPGQTPPANVPAFLGAPQSVAVGVDGIAFVAIEGVGVSSVQIGQAIPLDPAVPARGAGPRYPGAAESASDVTRLGDRLLVAGVAGLTVLDAATLQRIGGVSTTGNAQGVAALPAFRMDVNGDGVVAPGTEVFDLAVVANGLDGTLQFYRVPTSGDPVLLSAVRFSGETTDVALDADERLAYVGLGSRGLAIVDLDGPASVQPIDVDRDGADDRVLASVDTSGSSARLALDLPRGIGLVADGSGGLAVLQLLPPRTRFLTLQRDPVSSTVGDEESILESREAFTTDNAVQVTVNTATTSDSAAVLVIQETTPGGIALTFANGTRVQPLVDGLNSFSLAINADQIATRTTFALSVHTSAGAMLGSLALRIGPPDTRGATLRSLRIGPRPAVIARAATNLQLSVSGVLSDGRILNLTRAATGTVYGVQDPRIGTIETDGLAIPGGGGISEISVRNQQVVADELLRVDRDAVLTGLEAAVRFVTLTSPAERHTLDVVARFSDGSTVPVANVPGTAFVSSDPAVLSVDAAGVLAPLANGDATIAVTNGAFSAQVNGAVEFRTAPVVTGIDLLPVAGLVTTDDGEVQARATVAGTGSLEGLTVTFSIAGSSVPPLAGLTSHGGIALAMVQGLAAAGTFTLTASVVNPATGQTLSDSETLTVAPGSADHEPNAGDTTASRLAPGRTINGTLNGTTDPSDAFRTEASAAGTLTITFTLPPGASAAGLTVVVRNASGVEIGRFTPAAGTNTFTVAATAGQTFVSVEGSAAIAYSLSVRFVQREIAITSVAPASGGPGTIVTIDGSGFSSDAGRTRVLFGGIVGKLVAASPSRIQAQVPANAVTGALEIISGDRRLLGPQFATGNAGPPAPIFILPSDLANVRTDPVTRTVLDVTRLHVFFDALVTRAQAEARATQLGATVVGINPTLNAYMFEFSQNRTIAGLEGLRRQLGADPLVRFISRQTALAERAHPIDARDNSGNWAGTSVSRGVAYDAVKLFDALEAIRETPPFDVTPAPFPTVRTAILDTGFDPRPVFDFQYLGSGPLYVDLFTKNAAGVYALSPSQDSDGHGTAVTSVIAAANDGLGSSGVLHGVLKPSESPLPFPVRVYQIVEPNLNLAWDVGAVNAFTDIARLNGSGVEFDAVNISWGWTYAADSEPYQTAQAPFRDAMALLAGRTLVTVAAGNDGVDTRFDVPSALAVEMPHVMSIGGTAAGNLDLTGEGPNDRALFNPALANEVPPATPCTPIWRKGSACGPSVTLAAPAEDILMAWHLGNVTPPIPAIPPSYRPVGQTRGTSFSAPMVAGVAALLQAIRDGATPLTPARIRQLLVDTGDDISRTWTPFTMRRLNALAAVRAMLRIDPDNQHIYVADNDAPAGNGRQGRIIGINVDPDTGQRRGGPFDKEIELGFGLPGAVFLGTNPTALIASPTRGRLYAIVSSVTPDMGDGVLVINTLANRAENFIPLSGEPFPPVPGASGFSSVTVPTLRPGIALSKDGRLLYVGVGRRLIAINTVSEQVVRSFADLPYAYNSLASAQPGNTLALRTDAIDIAAFLAPPARVGLTITALTVSPNGRTLYAAIQSGGGAGQQPGGALAIDIDLYRDAEPDTPGLQSDLSTYLTPLPPAMRMQTLAGSTGASLGDEPSAIAVSDDGNHLYLLNGGLDFFSTVTPGDLDLRKFYMIVGGPILAALIGAPAGFLGVMTTLASFDRLAPQLYEDLLRDLRQISEGGVTFIAAPGFTGVFDASPGSGTFGRQSQLFSGDVVFGWSPSPANGGLIVNQFRFPEVFAQRPFGMTTHRNGLRAIVPYFQTGNFGVLDLNYQTNLPNPTFAGQPALAFHGTVAVTRALPLDNHLWPKRGTFTSEGVTVQSPDEALLFTWQAEYAQNGKFAVASHAGGRLPYSVTAPLPNWQQNPGALSALLQLGFRGFSGSSAQDADGNPVSVGQPYSFVRGGGAVSVIDNSAIDIDLAAHITDILPSPVDGTPRPYFATAPIRPDAVSHVFGYQTPSGRTQFYQPRGIAVTPFVQIESPHFGDPVSLGTGLHIRWRDSRIMHYEVRIEDATGNSIAGKNDQLSADHLASRSFSVSLGDVLAGNPPHPIQGQTYRIVVAMYTSSTLAVEISRTSIMVKFEQ